MMMMMTMMMVVVMMMTTTTTTTTTTTMMMMMKCTAIILQFNNELNSKNQRFGQWIGFILLEHHLGRMVSVVEGSHMERCESILESEFMASIIITLSNQYIQQL